MERKDTRFTQRLILILAVVTLLAIPAAVAAQTRPMFCEAMDVIPEGRCDVVIRDNYYTLSFSHIPTGTTVTWRNLGSQPHTVAADFYAFDSGPIAPRG